MIHTLVYILYINSFKSPELYQFITHKYYNNANQNISRDDNSFYFLQFVCLAYVMYLKQLTVCFIYPFQSENKSRVLI